LIKYTCIAKYHILYSAQLEIL